MASSSRYPPAPAASPALQSLPCFWAPLAPSEEEWAWPQGPSSGASSSSPASSPESGFGSLSPAYAPPPLQSPAAAALLPPTPRAKGSRRGRLGDGQRQSASQREKLRMRRLAGALHMLRRFLPPSVAPAGQSLTKIETLRLAIRYIAHLSDLLGLSQELLAWRGAAARARRCHLCPPGLGCGQPAASPPLQSQLPASPEAAYCLLQPPAAAAAPSSGPTAPEAAAASHCAVGAHVEERAGSTAMGDAAELPQQVDFSDAQVSLAPTCAPWPSSELAAPTCARRLPVPTWGRRTRAWLLVSTRPHSLLLPVPFSPSAAGSLRRAPFLPREPPPARRPGLTSARSAGSRRPDSPPAPLHRRGP